LLGLRECTAGGMAAGATARAGEWYDMEFCARQSDTQVQLGGRMVSDAIFEVTDSNFDQEVLKSEQPVMVDFWAAWCGPCRALAPLVDEIAKSYNGKIRVAKMDVDKNMSTPQRYGVRGIPTLLIFKGGQVREQIVGYVPKETITKALDKSLV
jgi:thioredoxin 1